MCVLCVCVCVFPLYVCVRVSLCTSDGITLLHMDITGDRVGLKWLNTQLPADVRVLLSGSTRQFLRADDRLNISCNMADLSPVDSTRPLVASGDTTTGKILM